MRPCILITVVVTLGAIFGSGCDPAKPQVVATAVRATPSVAPAYAATIPPLTPTRLATPTRTPMPTPSPTDSRIIIPAASPDEFEPDNRLEQAKPILVGGVTATHTLAPTGDQDWIVFDAIEGIEYLIETFDASPDISTDIVLVDQSERVLARGQPDGNVSRLTWMPDYGDPYYLIISERSTSQDTTYWAIKDAAFQVVDRARSYQVRVTPNSNLVILATNNTKGPLAFIDLKPLRVKPNPTPPVVTTVILPQFAKSLEITPNGRYAVVTMNDSRNHVAIVDLVTLKPIFTGGSGTDEMLTLTPDSNYAIVSSRSDAKLTIINLIKGPPGPVLGATCPITLKQSAKLVNVTTDTPANKYVLVTTLFPDEQLVIIPIGKAFCGKEFTTPIKVKLPGTAKSVKITPDNRFAVVVTNVSDREVTVVDLVTFVPWNVKMGWTVQ